MVNIDPKPSTRAEVIKQLFAVGNNQGGLRTYLIRGTAGVFVLQIIATGLGFVTNILLARFLGATDFGIYTYIFAWLGLLTVFCMLGFGQLLVREISSYVTTEKYGVIRGFLSMVAQYSFTASILTAALFSLGIWIFRGRIDPQTYPAFLISMLALPALTFITLSDSAMQGFKRVILGRFPQILIRTPLIILFIVIAYLINPHALNALKAVELSILAIVIAAIVGLFLVIKILPQQVKKSPPEFQRRVWLRSAFPLLLVAGLFELNTRIPAILLGTLVGPKETGLFTIDLLVASLISFILVSANAALGPAISSLYTTKDMVKLQQVITNSARITFSLALLVALVIFLLRYWILFLFGPEFQQSAPSLIILCIGQLINVASGSVGLLLIMTGHEKSTLIAIALATGLSFILNSLLIPVWGVEGAALATTFSVILWNTFLISLVIYRLGIDPTALGLLRKKTPQI